MKWTTDIHLQAVGKFDIISTFPDQDGRPQVKFRVRSIQFYVKNGHIM